MSQPPSDAIRTPPPSVILAAADKLIAAGELERAWKLLSAGQRTHNTHAGLARRLGDVLQASGRLEEATTAYEYAAHLDPSSADAWFGAGCAYLARQAPGDAVKCLARAAALTPSAGPVHYNLAKARFSLGRVEQAMLSFAHAEALGRDAGRLATESIACVIPGSPKADHLAVLDARRLWALAAAKGLDRMTPPATPATGRKLRIGYVSSFFDQANWMKPVFGMINRHDRNAFDIYMLATGGPPSPASGYREWESDFVFDLSDASNAEAAGAIAEAGIDVLVDLNGYSDQDRLGVMMHRPAPHIVGWFNMFATTGIEAFDWIVGDDAVTRTGEARFHTERIHRLPGSYLAFEVLYDVPDVAPPPSLTAGGAICFGYLGSQYKLTDGVLTAWGRILRGAPKATLFIKNGDLGDTSTREDLTARLKGLGVDPARVTLEGRSPHFEFLDAYRKVDIALDTFPYNGGTTTTEALWQGVPVLSFDGDRWASRTSKSLLLAANMADWVMPDLDGYVTRAIALANDPATPAHLAAARAGMRDHLRASAACDTETLCRSLEAFYRTLVLGETPAD